jgi:hypothetical protein
MSQDEVRCHPERSRRVRWFWWWRVGEGLVSFIKRLAEILIGFSFKLNDLFSNYVLTFFLEKKVTKSSGPYPSPV